MSDDTTSTDPGQDPATSPDPATEAPTADLGEAGKKALAEERRARKAAETAAKDFEARLAQFEDAQKTDLEKATSKAEKAEQAYQQLEQRWHAAQVSNALTQAAVTAQAVDVEAVLALAHQRGQFTVNDEGEVSGADKAIADLIKSKPHLFNTRPAGSRDANASSPPPALNSDRLTEALGRAVGAN